MSEGDDLGPEYRVSYPLNITLTNVMFRCTRCREWKPGADFGLRCMEDETIRNQPQCKTCRSRPRLQMVR